MNRGAWWATVHGVSRVEHNLVTKPPPPPKATLNITSAPSSLDFSLWGAFQRSLEEKGPDMAQEPDPLCLFNPDLGSTREKVYNCSAVCLVQGRVYTPWGKEGLVGDGEWNPFSWEGTPGGRGTSRIRVGEQDDPSSEYQRVRPVSWVLAWPRRA